MQNRELPYEVAKQDDQKPWTIGPNGEVLTKDDLPKRGERWTAFKKAAVVAALQGGLVTIADMLQSYDLTIEELSTWQRGFDRFGMLGLRTTKSQKVRDRIVRDILYS